MSLIRFSKVKARTEKADHDLIFLSEAKLKLIQRAHFLSDWSSEAMDQLKKKLKGFELEETAPYKTISVHFEDGRTAHILPLPEKMKTFDLHATLRSAFSGVVKAQGNSTYFVDTTLLPKATQILLVDGVVSLAVLETWDHPKYTKKKAKNPAEKSTAAFEFLTTLTPQELTSAVEVAETLATSTNLVRTLGEMPANFLKPDAYRELIQKRAKERGYSYSFLSMKDLRKMGAGCFVAVAKGDPDDLGGIVKLTFKPKAKPKKKIALVGKGICFDTGGYNIKTSNYMHGMHRDMTGSAVTLALFEALKALEVPFEVEAYLAIAENLISPHANRPNDLIYALNGTSVEMVDTDAEGRLVLADTLTLASREKPDLVLDFATLTGAAVRSLDSRRAAIFSNSEKRLQQGHTAGEACGERTWGFPIGEDYWTKLKSDVADMRQCATHSNSDHIYAATFLSHFVEKGVEWVHMDLSPDTNAGGLGLVKSEITGFGVRWGYEMLKNL